MCNKELWLLLLLTSWTAVGSGQVENSISPPSTSQDDDVVIVTPVTSVPLKFNNLSDEEDGEIIMGKPMDEWQFHETTLAKYDDELESVDSDNRKMFSEYEWSPVPRRDSRQLNIDDNSPDYSLPLQDLYFLVPADNQALHLGLAMGSLPAGDPAQSRTFNINAGRGNNAYGNSNNQGRGRGRLPKLGNLFGRNKNNQGGGYGNNNSGSGKGNRGRRPSAGLFGGKGKGQEGGLGDNLRRHRQRMRKGMKRLSTMVRGMMRFPKFSRGRRKRPNDNQYQNTNNVDNYNAPANNYNAPSNSYNAPSNSYNAPSNSYNAPSNSYNAPSNSYNAPSSNSYNAPTNNYNAPSTVSTPTYSTPVQAQQDSYGSPISKPIAAQDSYGAPQSQPLTSYTSQPSSRASTSSLSIPSVSNSFSKSFSSSGSQSSPTCFNCNLRPSPTSSSFSQTFQSGSSNFIRNSRDTSQKKVDLKDVKEAWYDYLRKAKQYEDSHGVDFELRKFQRNIVAKHSINPVLKGKKNSKKKKDFQGSGYIQETKEEDISPPPNVFSVEEVFPKTLQASGPITQVQVGPGFSHGFQTPNLPKEIEETLISRDFKDAEDVDSKNPFLRRTQAESEYLQTRPTIFSNLKRSVEDLDETLDEISDQNQHFHSSIKYNKILTPAPSYDSR